MAGPWKCPKCKREFEKKGQSHSCNVFPLIQHFKGKGELTEALYKYLKEKIKKNVGGFKVDSIPCCIHLVSTFTFTAVRILKNKIRVSFTLDHKLDSTRVRGCQEYSANRFLHEVDIESTSQIDKELLDWVSQAFFIRNKDARKKSSSSK